MKMSIDEARACVCFGDDIETTIDDAIHWTAEHLHYELCDNVVPPFDLISSQRSLDLTKEQGVAIRLLRNKMIGLMLNEMIERD